MGAAARCILAKMQTPLVAVITKYCFCAEHLHTAKAGHWKGCSGPERRRNACAGAIEKIASECKSQKTYKPLNPKKRKGRGAERKGDGVSCLPVFHMSQKRWFHNHRFFISRKLFILKGAVYRRKSRPRGQRELHI